MEVGYLYIISQKTFGENVFKLGYSFDNKKKLLSRYNTYYVDPIKIEDSYLVCDKVLSEKLLFHRLRKYRIRDKREFFKCPLDILKKTCEEVMNMINEGENDIMDLEEQEVLVNVAGSENDRGLAILNKCKQKLTKRREKEKEIKLKRNFEKKKMYNEYEELIKKFIAEECEVDEKSNVRSSILFKKFKEWNKTDAPVDVKIFSPIVEGIGYVKIKTEMGYIFRKLTLKKQPVVKEQIKIPPTLLKFLEDNYTIDPYGFVYHRSLFEEYKKKYNDDISAKMFTMMMQDKGYLIKKKKDGNGFKGLSAK